MVGLLLHGGRMGTGAHHAVRNCPQETGVLRRQAAGHERVFHDVLLVQKFEPHASAKVLAREACVVRRWQHVTPVR